MFKVKVMRNQTPFNINEALQLDFCWQALALLNSKVPCIIIINNYIEPKFIDSEKILVAKYNTRNRVINSYIHKCYKENLPIKIVCPISVLPKVSKALQRDWFDYTKFKVVFVREVN